MNERQDQHVTKQQTIEVNGISLIVACTAPGTRYLSVSAICKALRIDHRTQLRRIRSSDELSQHLSQLMLHFLSGGDQPVYCLPIEIIEPWLSPRTGLQPDTVKLPYQPLLQIFQQELLSIVDETCPLPRPLEIPFQESWRERWEGETETNSRGLMVPSQIPGVEEETPLAAQHVLAAQLPQAFANPHLLIPLYAYAEHTAFREASVAKGHRWTKEEDDDPYFRSPSTTLQVYVSRPSQPIGLDAAMRRIAELGPSTVLVARIAFGLWNARRNDRRYAENGWVAIEVEEFLLLRNLQMHTRAVSADSAARVSDGTFEKKFIDRLQRDLELLNGSHIRRWVTSDNYYDSPYLRVSMLMERLRKRRGQEKQKQEKDRLVRVAVSPGEWMPRTYHQTFDKFAMIDGRINALSLKPEMLYALLLSLFLSERWRQQALQELENQGTLERGGVPEELDPLRAFKEPIRMKDLLEASVIDIDYINLTSRFAPAIEAALQKLVEKQILAEPAKYLTPINKNQNWGNAWLDARVVLLPMLDVEEEVQEMVIVEEVYQLSLLQGSVEKRSTSRRRTLPPPISS